MDRRGVAATIASVVVFTTMLLANTAVYAAQNGYLSAVTISGAQVQERELAVVLVGLSSYSSLAFTQSFLQSTPMDCTSPGPYLAAVAGSGTQISEDQGIDYGVSSSWSYVPAPVSERSDALLPSQFVGYGEGDLNLRVVTVVNESFAGGLPSYSVQYVEVVHIPVHLQVIVSACLSALSEIRSALSTLASCDASAVEQALSVAKARSVAPSSFEDGASASSAAGRCFVSYWVTTTQTGIPGVSGAFQWTVSGSGSLSTLPVPVSPPFLA